MEGFHPMFSSSHRVPLSGCAPPGSSIRRPGYYLRHFLLLSSALLLASSCTLLNHSAYIARNTTMPIMGSDDGLVVSPSGDVPYQTWRVPPWDDKLRYVWLVGNYDFRRFDKVEMIFYFHGMHSKDYYTAFRNELETLAQKRPDRPFLFVGFVDSPLTDPESRSKERWASLAPKESDRPDCLFQTVNHIFKAFRWRFPHIRKEKTNIVLAGFSGGGRVLHSVGNWLARSPKDDPYAEVFRSRLTKLVYFDCWFERDVIETVPALLEGSPRIKIVSTVHMKKPMELASALANKFKMKRRKEKNELVGLDGRIVILGGASHWDAMISRLAEAL